jgi:archaeosine-15-forming tRNA-guanine transglycosylase
MVDGHLQSSIDGAFVAGKKKPAARVITGEEGEQYRAAGKWVRVAGFVMERGHALSPTKAGGEGT